MVDLDGTVPPKGKTTRATILEQHAKALKTGSLTTRVEQKSASAANTKVRAVISVDRPKTLIDIPKHLATQPRFAESNLDTQQPTAQSSAVEKKTKTMAVETPITKAKLTGGRRWVRVEKEKQDVADEDEDGD